MTDYMRMSNVILDLEDQNFILTTALEDIASGNKVSNLEEAIVVANKALDEVDRRAHV